MRIRIMLLVFCSVIFFNSQGRPSIAGEYALIIGINKYSDINKPLVNPVNDATSLKQKLEEINFGRGNITLKADLEEGLDQDAMQEAYNAFVKKLEKVDKGSVALFYFSGHGVEYAGQNYLIPSDIKGTDVDKLFAETKRPQDFAKRTLVLNDMLDQIADVRIKRNLTVIFIIDACRERPEAAGRTKSIIALSGGLAPVSAKKVNGMFIMYAAGASQKALDSAGGNTKYPNNSVYTANLLDVLSNHAKKTGGPGLAWMAQEIREKVYVDTNAVKHPQNPAYYDHFTRRMNLFGNAPKTESHAGMMAMLADKASKTKLSRSLSTDQPQKDQPFKECIECPEMVAISGGSYLRGSAKTESGRGSDEGPQASVQINSFALSRTEISNHQWNLCVAGKGCKGKGRPEKIYPPLEPVTNVSWLDAKDYAAWLNKITQKNKGDSAAYRLASESEWEYAARAKTTGRYFFGEDTKQLCDYGNGADQKISSLLFSNHHCSDGYGSKVSPIGIYKANDFKLFGMIGNVAEWVEDCYVNTYKGAPVNEAARLLPEGKTTCQRVVRSGSWRSGVNALRSAARNKYDQSHARPTIGIRIARNLDVGAMAKAQAKRVARRKAEIAKDTKEAKDKADAKTPKPTNEDETRLAAKAKQEEEERQAAAKKIEDDRLKAAADQLEADKAKAAAAAALKQAEEDKIKAAAAKRKKAEEERIKLAALTKPKDETTKPASNVKQLFTAAQVRRFSPRARRDIVEGLVANQQYFHEAGINTRWRLVHFFTQIGLETAGLRRLDENMNYSAKTLLKVFSRRTVTAAKAREIARQPRKVANWVYGARLGNKGRHTNDGWSYRGSGYIQLTGRNNFRARGKEVNLRLEAVPETARQPKEGLNAATAYWTARKINKAADKNALRRVRVLVNGKAAHGFGASKIWYRKAKKIFMRGTRSTRSLVSPAEEKRKEQEEVSSLLGELGFTKGGSTRSTTRGDRSSSPLSDFQKSRGLTVTGKFDEDTLYAITDPQEWRHRGQ